MPVLHQRQGVRGVSHIAIACGLSSKLFLNNFIGVLKPLGKRSASCLVMEHTLTSSEALDFFLHYKIGEQKQRTSNRVAISRSIRILETTSRRHGLEPSVLEDLLRVVVKDTFTCQMRHRLVKCLIPTSVVSRNAPVIAVASLCTETLPPTLQVLLVQWLILVFDLVDNKSDFHCLYEMIFYLVQFDNLSPYVCHLLYLLTRRKDVKRFRVQKLLRIMSAQGSNPQLHLQGLLSLYKTYRPEYVSLSVPSDVRRYFPSVNRAWAQLINLIQVKHSVKCGIQRQVAPQGAGVLEKRLSRKRERDLAPVAYSQGLSTGPPARESSSGLHLDDVWELLGSPDDVDMTDGLSSLFGSPFTLCRLSCSMDDVKRMRIDYSVDHVLQHEFWNDVTTPRTLRVQEEFLDGVVRAQDILKECLPGIEHFLSRWLHVWDGETLRLQTLNLLAQVPLCESSELKRKFLRPLSLLMMTSSIHLKCAVLKSLQQLLLNWQTRDLPKLQTQLMSPDNLDDQGGVEARDAVVAVISFVDEISNVVLQQEGYSALLIHVLLSFYQTAGELWPRLLDNIMIMPDCMIYPSFLTYDPSCLNRLCQILCSYRDNIIAAKSDAALQSRHAPGKLSMALHTHNTVVQRMMGCIWKGLAFHGNQGLGCFVDSSLQSTSSFCLYLTCHPALLGFAIGYVDATFGRSENLFKDLERIKGPEIERFLQYLDEQGVASLPLLLQKTIRKSKSSRRPVNPLGSHCDSG
uniref:Centromere protein I n=1 Tax=Eptatretus burgeri TaxID=7764 RepID=A0A8C4Q727_EPTBU